MDPHQSPNKTNPSHTKPHIIIPPNCGYKWIHHNQHNQHHQNKSIQHTHQPPNPSKIIKQITILSDKNVKGPENNQMEKQKNDAECLDNPINHSLIYKNSINQPQQTISSNPINMLGINAQYPETGLSRLNKMNEQTSYSNILLEQKYRLYLKYFRENRLIQKQLAHVEEEKRIFRQKLNELENSLNLSIQESSNNYQNNVGKSYNKKKRHRRQANEILRNFACPIDDCDRMYGTEPSLLQHVKLKHQKQYKQSQGNLGNLTKMMGKGDGQI